MNNNKKVVFRTKWFGIEQEHFNHIESLGGEPYYSIHSPDEVIILAMTEKNEIILVKQFRPALNQYTLELPSGSINEGESPYEAAKRELYEETGYECTDMNAMSSGRIMMNRHTSREFTFFGTGGVKIPDFTCKEEIGVVLMTSMELKAFTLSGQFEQIAGLGLLVLANWEMGNHFVH